MDGCREVVIEHHRMVEALGVGDDLLLELKQSCQLLLREPAPRVVGAQGTVPEGFPSGHIQDTQNGSPQVGWAYDPEYLVTALYHQADSLPHCPPDTRLDGGFEDHGLLDNTLEDRAPTIAGEVGEGFAGIEGVGLEKLGLGFWEQVSNGGSDKPGADVVAQPQLTDQEVGDGGLTGARRTPSRMIRGLLDIDGRWFPGDIG